MLIKQQYYPHFRPEINKFIFFLNLPMKCFVPQCVESNDFVFEICRRLGFSSDDLNRKKNPLRIFATGRVEIGQEIVNLEVDVEQVRLQLGQVYDGGLERKII